MLIRSKVTSPYGDYNNKHQHLTGQDQTVFTKHKRNETKVIEFNLHRQYL